ncbi:CCA tRNA nucleotidyltransferase [Fructilactobacillus vespulae]|uniref:CCA tRNA nucleotidyltransferase n=1 Tax=Fructilactobacillus vespulae TaxID=1249630 RepID=UPI0039B6065A
MQVKKLPIEFIDGRSVLRKIEENGYEAYFVGGSVRDTLLKLPIHDVDMATSAYPSEIKTIFKRTIDTGIDHGTVTVLFDNKPFEITTFRTESGYQDYRRPDKVTFIRSLKEDLKRRDFTINAFAMRENGEIIDLFDGRTDLKERKIKAVGDANLRFNEDALRMMRAVRFASQLDFQIEAKTFQAIKDNCQLIQKIAIERINVEFIKMMLGIKPERGLQQMLDTNLFENIPFFNDFLDDLKLLLNKDLMHKIHNEVQVWTLFSIQFKLDEQMTKKMMRIFKCSNKLINDVVAATKGCNLILQNQLDAFNLYQIGKVNILNANQSATIYGGQIKEEKLLNDFNSLPIKEKHELEINGGFLIKNGIKPGPKLGKVLKQLEFEVVDGKLLNNQSQLLNRANEILESN